MPTYEYECAKGHRFEKFQSMKDNPIKTCPECKSKTKRLIGSGAGVIFKGSGFYQTDYRSSDYKKKSEAEKSSPQPTVNSPQKKETKSSENSPPPTQKVKADRE